MNTLEQNKDNCWRSFNDAMRKINEGNNVEYYSAVAKEAISEYVDFAGQIAKSKGPIEYPTYSRNLKRAIAVIFLALCFNCSFAQDTIHVDKVFINGQIVNVDLGYIIHDHKKWIVNGKQVKLYRYKKTELADFKKENQSPSKTNDHDNSNLSSVNNNLRSDSLLQRSGSASE